MRPSRVILAASLAATMLAVSAAPAHAQARRVRKLTFKHIAGGTSATLAAQKLQIKAKVTLVNAEIQDCNKDVKVKFQRKVDGDWKTIATDRTNDNGVAKVVVGDKTGRYRGVAPLTQSESTGFDCFKATSEVSKHSH